MSIMLLRISIALVSSARPTINWSQKIVFICFSEIFFSRIVGLVTTWHHSDQTTSNNVVENIQLLLLRITRSYTNKITELMHSILPAPVRSPGLISVFVKCFLITIQQYQHLSQLSVKACLDCLESTAYLRSHFPAIQVSRHEGEQPYLFHLSDYNHLILSDPQMKWILIIL